VLLGADELARLPRWPWYVNLADDPDLTEEAYRADEAEVIEEIHAILAAELAATDRKEVFVFVHGFNNTFAYAAQSMSELWHMAGRPGVAILYSWPAARAGIFGYNPDRESSEFTVSHLKQFLRILAAADTVERIHVISHSRGTDVLVTALRELYIEHSARGPDAVAELKLGNAVFAAADIDMDVATQRIGGEEVLFVADRFTTYTSAGDTALKLSANMFKSSARVGQAGPEAVRDFHRVTLRMLEDRSSVIYDPKKTGFLGHSGYLYNPRVSSDLILLLRDDRSPGAENGRPLLRDPTGLWVIPEDYPNVANPEAAD
jgi:esterase/lipase superfamily enzyme